MTVNSIQQATVLTGSNVKLSDGSTLNLADITTRNYEDYSRDFNADEQRQAGAIARFVHNYEQTISLNETQVEALSHAALGAIPEYFRLLNQGADALRDSSDEGVQLLRNLVEQDPSMSATLEAIRDNGAVATVENIGALSNAINGVAGGAMGTVEFLTKLPGAAILLGDTLLDGAGSGYSNAQSEAFGTAYVLAQREAARRGGLEEQVSTRAANVLDNIFSYAQAAWVSIPVLPQIASFIASGEFSAEGWALAGERIAAEKAERAAAAGGSDFASTRQYFLEKNTTSRRAVATQTTALEIVASTEEIAGVPTQEVTNLLSRGGTYLNQDGKEIEISPVTPDGEIQETETGRDRWDHLAEKANINPARIFVQEDGSPNYFGAIGSAAVAGGIYHYRQPILNVGRGALNAGGRTVIGGTRMVTAGATGLAEGGLQSAAAWGQRAGASAEAVAPIRAAGNNVGQGGRVATVLDDAATAVGGSRLGLQGTRTAAVGRLAGRAAVPIAAGITVLDGVSMVDALQEGDTRRAVGSGTAFGTALAGAAAGAGVGLLGGPFAPVTSTAGAVVGFAVGGIAAIFTKPMAERAYDRHVERNASADTQIATADAASTDPQAEQRRLQQARLQADGVNLTASGGVTTDGPNGASNAVGGRTPVLLAV